MPTCEICGFSYRSSLELRSHQIAHDRFLNGPETTFSDGIHLVLPRNPLPHRRAAENAAKIFRQEMGYDQLCYHATDSDDFRRCKTSAAIYVRGNRVVGLLVERDRKCNLYECRDLADSNRAKLEQREPTICRQVDVVWVLGSQRGQGLGKALMNDFLKRLGTDKPLAVQLPASAVGKRLLLSVGLQEFWISIAW